jgi:hypothetical protein
MNRLFVWAGLAVAAGAASAGPARAQIVYEFFNNTIGSGGTKQTSFTMPTSSTLPVYVYMHDTSTNGGNPGGGATINGDAGLVGAGVRVTYSNAGVASLVLAGTATNPTNPAPGVPPWASATDNGSNGSSAVLNDQAPLTGSTGVTADANGLVFLGTFTFTSGSVTGTENLTAADPNPGSGGDVTSFNSFTSYDALLQNGAATLTVAGVPEPTSLALAGLAAAGLTARLRRYRRSGSEVTRG